ncbi:MAG: hypothetical protein ABSC56_11845 [Solirubrobacteraceae bacterium]|jgi:ABC-type glycerol-3-phosphate transport system substrate-binding protein
MKTIVAPDTGQRPPLRRMLLAALAGGLGVFSLGADAAASSAATQTSPSTLTTSAHADGQPGR